MEKKIGEVENKIPNISGLVTTITLNTKIGEIKKKIPDSSGLMTTAVNNTKIGEVKNKIPDVCSLVKKSVYDAKISDIEEKYFAASDYNKLMTDILDEKIKEKNWSINLIFSIF